MLLYLVRHAKPEMAGTFIGTTDPPLSDEGRLHAQETLATLVVSHVFTSPLRRAQETAAFIKAPSTVVPDLRSCTLARGKG